MINLSIISYNAPKLFSAICSEINTFKYKHSTTVKYKG